jgi:hypothetical protein
MAVPSNYNKDPMRMVPSLPHPSEVAGTPSNEWAENTTSAIHSSDLSSGVSADDKNVSSQPPGGWSGAQGSFFRSRVFRLLNLSVVDRERPS